MGAPGKLQHALKLETPLAPEDLLALVELAKTFPAQNATETEMKGIYTRAAPRSTSSGASDQVNGWMLSAGCMTRTRQREENGDGLELASLDFPLVLPPTRPACVIASRPSLESNILTDGCTRSGSVFLAV